MQQKFKYGGGGGDEGGSGQSESESSWGSTKSEFTMKHKQEGRNLRTEERREGALHESVSLEKTGRADVKKAG